MAGGRRRGGAGGGGSARAPGVPPPGCRGCRQRSPQHAAAAARRCRLPARCPLPPARLQDWVQRLASELIEDALQGRDGWHRPSGRARSTSAAGGHQAAAAQGAGQSTRPPSVLTCAAVMTTHGLIRVPAAVGGGGAVGLVQRRSEAANGARAGWVPGAARTAARVVQVGRRRINAPVFTAQRRHVTESAPGRAGDNRFRRRPRRSRQQPDAPTFPAAACYCSCLHSGSRACCAWR